MHQFSLIPTGTINVSGEMSYLWQAVRHKLAFSSLCPYDELAGPGLIKLIEVVLSGGSLGNYNSLFGAVCSDAMAIRGE